MANSSEDLISTDCKIKPASKPENSERTCWNYNCSQPLPKGARKWCAMHPLGDEFYVQHHINTSRWVVIQSSRIAIKGNPFGSHECAICHSVTNNPEVDHKIAMGGDDRSKPDCRHHTSNLRVLCHDCHRGVSAQQAANRAAFKRNGSQPTQTAMMI